jgi:prepilin-type N-terminal cleavage/methylation domain-containing protein
VRGFTLIELLVVIAIIAILAAILFPVFARAKEQTHKTLCTSNMKQIAMAQLLYTNDYDDMFALLFTRVDASFPHPFNVSGSVRTASWHNLIQPYAKSWEINVCKAYPPFTRTDPTYRDPFLGFAMAPRSDLYNQSYWIDRYYTRGRAAMWQGIAGAFNDNGWSRVQTGMPSLRSTEIFSHTRATLVLEATSPDMWLSRSGAPPVRDNTFNYYIASWYPGYGAQTFGPLGRHMMRRRNYISYLTDPGQIVTIYADGSAKAADFFQWLRLERIGSNNVYRNLWVGPF